MFISTTEIKINFIAFLVLWAVRWLYRQLTISDDSKPNHLLAQDKPKYNSQCYNRGDNHLDPYSGNYKDESNDKSEIKEKIDDKDEPRDAKPQSHQLIPLKRKRKVFKNSLILDALMKPKYFIN